MWLRIIHLVHVEVLTKKHQGMIRGSKVSLQHNVEYVKTDQRTENKMNCYRCHMTKVIVYFLQSAQFKPGGSP